MDICEKKREANRESDLTIKKLSVAGGEVGGGQVKWVMGIKEDICDEHWVLYVSDESLKSYK